MLARGVEARRGRCGVQRVPTTPHLCGYVHTPYLGIQVAPLSISSITTKVRMHSSWKRSTTSIHTCGE